MSLGTFGTEKEAQLAELRAEAGVEQEGKPFLPPKAIPRGREKFGKFALEVIQAKQHTWAKSTYYAHLRNLEKHLKPLHSTALADLTYSAVVRWWHSMEDQPVARKQSYGTLRMVMARAVRLGNVASSPCQIEGATKDYSKKRKTFHAADVRMLIEMTGDIQMKAALRVMLGTGVRIGELLALNWEDVDLAQGRITVHKHLTPYGVEEGTKHHEDGRRVLLMPRDAEEALRTLSQSKVPVPGHPVFTNAWGRRMTYKAFTYKFNPLRDSCALDELRPHDIRHIHLSEYGRHATLKEVMERGGHTDVSSALRYQHTDEERERQIVEKLAL